MAAPTSTKTAQPTSGKTATKSRAATHHVGTLVDLVRQSSATLFHDAVGRAQITFSVGQIADETRESIQKSYQNHRETHLLRSPAARHWIAQLYQAHAGAQPAASHLQAALNLLEGRALHECAQLDVHLRLAEHDGRIYLDLADDQWRAIEIDTTGWRVVAEPPVRFRRAPFMLPLPLPRNSLTAEPAECRRESTGVQCDIHDDHLADVSDAVDKTTEPKLASPLRSSAPSAVNSVFPPAPVACSPKSEACFSLLRSFINVNDEHWPLVLGWLVAALRPRGPYPILCLHGEQGSAKSTAALLLRSLVDPSAAPHRGEPRQVRDLATAASAGHVVCLDNLSRLPDWLSNALCRLSTGAGQTTRSGSDRDTELVFAASRPSMLVGIDPLAARGDLVDRALLVPLRPIDPSNRRTEEEIHERFASVRPQILAGLCNAVATALANLPTTRLARLPRMADFAVWATAAEPALGLAPGEFLRAYEANRAAVHQQALEASPLIWAISDLLHDRDSWTGTATLLLMILEHRALESDLKDRAWPRSPRALSSQLRRLAPALRTMRVEVEFDRVSGVSRVREISLSRAATICTN